MLMDHFPLYGLRLRTPRLELRLPTPEELTALADLAVAGVHDPDVTPFIRAWTDGTRAEVAGYVLQSHWQHLGNWTPQDWRLDFTVFHAGTVVGQQNLRACDLAITREVSTSSWLGQRYQGQGIGTETRAAALHLAFAGLDAEEAVSGVLEHNLASQAVSRKLGYEPDGQRRHAVRGTLTVERRLRLTRAAWEQYRTVPIEIEGLDPCLPLFGINAA